MATADVLQSDEVKADRVRADFERVFGSAARLFRAPGRVNLIGEHTDYNEGFVMPAAIGFACFAAAAPREDRILDVYSSNFSERIRRQLDDPHPGRRGHWIDYVFGVAATLCGAGHRLRGANLAVGGDVPLGSGLSSSAALEVATAFALLGVSGVELDKTEIAALCQKAENEFVGARVGIMDQFVACYGRENHALMLDCQNLDYRYLPIPENVSLVICDTKVKHALAAGEYNARREQCERGVETLARFLPHVRSLRDVTETDLEQHRGDLDPVIFRRCRHVVMEIKRVLAAASALERGDLIEFGRLMGESHRSLRDDYEVSSSELDLLVNLSLQAGDEIGGVYGARMTGGGFGGCTINLVEREKAAEFRTVIAKRYQSAAGQPCAIYVCSAADGAKEIGRQE